MESWVCQMSLMLRSLIQKFALSGGNDTLVLNGSLSIMESFQLCLFHGSEVGRGCRKMACSGMSSFDVWTKEWSTVECYGNMPCARSAMGESCFYTRVAQHKSISAQANPSLACNLQAPLEWFPISLNADGNLVKGPVLCEIFHGCWCCIFGDMAMTTVQK